MGALHPGHLSLVAAAKQANGITVCSIFINPTQFNNPDDLAKYPVTIGQDIEQLLTAGCDVLFLPTHSEIYPADYIAPRYDLGHLETVLEGTHRPGHFQGVCQVVQRLLQTVQPTHLYLGAKDYQQVKVIEKLLDAVQLRELVQLHRQPTLREADGLAMSSRNLRLTEAQRANAPALYQALKQIQKDFNPENIAAIEATATASLTSNGFKVDYATIADADTLLQPTSETSHFVALVAVYLDDIRLIDNLELTALK